MLNTLQPLISLLSKLPSIGRRSAGRMALHLVQNKDVLLRPIVAELDNIASQIIECEVCYGLDVVSPCGICADIKRNKNVLCIVETVENIWAIEASKSFKGIYHVLGGSLSAIDGIMPDDLRFGELQSRMKNTDFTEIIIATNPTSQGQSTAFYIEELLHEYKNIKITKLALGLPIGAELDYMDEGTLRAAFDARA